MRILVVGGGPAGLSCAVALKELARNYSVSIVDSAAALMQSGYGITLPIGLLESVGITIQGQPLEEFSLVYRSNTHLPTPINCIGVGRTALLSALRARCSALGIGVKYIDNVDPFRFEEFAHFDVVIGADGAHSAVRSQFSAFFQPILKHSESLHVWAATPKMFGKRLVRMFGSFEGMLFSAAAYQHCVSASTVIIECLPDGVTVLHKKASRDHVSQSELLASIFSTDLGGYPLHVREPLRWQRFLRVTNRHWLHQHIVLIGDAAHTTHFSKGHGTVAAIRDAHCLARRLADAADPNVALIQFENERMPQVIAAQAKADLAQRWYEGLLEKYPKDSRSIDSAIAELESSRARRERQ